MIDASKTVKSARMAVADVLLQVTVAACAIFIWQISPDSAKPVAQGMGILLCVVCASARAASKLIAADRQLSSIELSQGAGTEHPLIQRETRSLSALIRQLRPSAAPPYIPHPGFESALRKVRLSMYDKAYFDRFIGEIGLDEEQTEKARAAAFDQADLGSHRRRHSRNGRVSRGVSPDSIERAIHDMEELL